MRSGKTPQAESTQLRFDWRTTVISRLGAERRGAIRDTLVDEKTLNRRSCGSKPRIIRRQIENGHDRNRRNPVRGITIHVRPHRLRRNRLHHRCSGISQPKRACRQANGEPADRQQNDHPLPVLARTNTSAISSQQHWTPSHLSHYSNAPRTAIETAVTRTQNAIHRAKTKTMSAFNFPLFTSSLCSAI